MPVHRHLRKTSPSSIIKNPASMHKKSHRLVTQVFDKIVQKAKFSCSFIRQTFVKVLRVSNRWERRRRSCVLFAQTLDGKGLFSPYGFRPGLPEMIAAVCCSRSRNQKPRVWRAKKKCTRIACVWIFPLASKQVKPVHSNRWCEMKAKIEKPSCFFLWAEKLR